MLTRLATGVKRYFGAFVFGEFLISFDISSELLTFAPSLDDLNTIIINTSSIKTRARLQCGWTRPFDSGGFCSSYLVRPFLLHDAK